MMNKLSMEYAFDYYAFINFGFITLFDCGQPRGNFDTKVGYACIARR